MVDIPPLYVVLRAAVVGDAAPQDGYLVSTGTLGLHPCLDAFWSHLSSQRVAVEQCYGAIKQRFRLVDGRKSVHYGRLVTALYSRAACILHNFCLLTGRYEGAEPAALLPRERVTRYIRHHALEVAKAKLVAWSEVGRLSSATPVGDEGRARQRECVDAQFRALQALGIVPASPHNANATTLIAAAQAV